VNIMIAVVTGAAERSKPNNRRMTKRNIIAPKTKIVHSTRNYKNALKGSLLLIETLLEVAHEHDALCNEVFNNVAAWLAPKNKVCGSPDSLKTRLQLRLESLQSAHLHIIKNFSGMLGLHVTNC